MLFHEKENYGDIENEEGGDGLPPADIAMKAFVPVENEAAEVESYMVTIKINAQFDLLHELIAASLSFRQVCKVVKRDREILKAASKQKPFSPGEAATLTRVASAIGLQTLSEMMKSSWAFTLELMIPTAMETLSWIVAFDFHL